MSEYDGQNNHSTPTQTTVSSVSLSALGITGFVLGLVALLISFIPIINNASFFIAILGLIFAIIGTVSCFRKTKRGKGLSIAGLAICVVSIIVVLATQSLFSKALDEAVEGPDVVSTSSTSSAQSDSSKSSEPTELAVGESATFDNGLKLSVDAVIPGLSNYDGTPITGITVTYSNTGKEEVSFNSWDWEGQDAQGVQSMTTYYSEAANELSAGSLAVGGTVTGNLYFDGETVKALYSSNLLSDSKTIWKLV